MLKVPEGAEAAFRIEAAGAFARRFAINVYGAGRSSRFVATNRQPGFGRDSGVQQLPKGESLPENGSHLTPPTVETEYGEWLTIAGRDATRYHRVHRFIWREPGLEAVLSFGRRVSGFILRHSASGVLIAVRQAGGDFRTPSLSGRTGRCARLRRLIGSLGFIAPFAAATGELGRSAREARCGGPYRGTAAVIRLRTRPYRGRRGHRRRPPFDAAYVSD